LDYLQRSGDFHRVLFTHASSRFDVSSAGWSRASPERLSRKSPNGPSTLRQMPHQWTRRQPLR